MRSLKASGMIKKIPGGRKPKTHTRKPEVNGVIEQARALVLSERAELPFAPETPWRDQTYPEKLTTLTGKALDKTFEILDLPCDPENLKLLSIQKDAALSVISTQTKVDENQLRRTQNEQERFAEMLRRIQEERAKDEGRPPRLFSAV